jgi:hypothetical protein
VERAHPSDSTPESKELLSVSFSSKTPFFVVGYYTLLFSFKLSVYWGDVNLSGGMVDAVFYLV